jgi:hypothetical protein
MEQRLPIHSRPSKGGRYWICYVRTPDGRRLQRALHIRDDGSPESRKAAVAAFWHEQARATNGQIDREARPKKTLGKALGALAAEQAVDGLTDATKHVSLWAADKLLEYFGADRDVEALTRQDMVDYATHARASRAASSVAIELRTFRRALECIDVKAPRRPKLGKQKAKRQEPLTQSQMRALLMAARKPKRRIVLLVALSLGIRRGEYDCLAEVNWESRLIHVAGTKTEDSDRWMPIPDELFEHMLAIKRTHGGVWPGFPIYSYSALNQIIVSTAERAGLGHRHWNDMRGTWSTQAALRGVSAAERAALQGNSEAMQVRVYSQPHLDAEQLRPAMENMPRMTTSPSITGASPNVHLAGETAERAGAQASKSPGK